MTLTDEQVRALTDGYDEDCPIVSLATEVLAQRARTCGTCAYWTPLRDQTGPRRGQGDCAEGHQDGCGWIREDWFCADWTAPETP